jgi:hypothetical protein
MFADTWSFLCGRLMMRMVLMLVASACNQALLAGRCLQKQLTEVLPDVRSSTFIISSLRLLCLVLCLFVFSPFSARLRCHVVDDGIGHTTCDHPYSPAG